MWVWWIVLGLVLAVVVYDLFQRKHAILRNFPIIGHFRYLLEAVGPELRQYIVTGNDEERPFSRDQRRWIYASSKKQNNYFGFGTDNHFEEESNYLIIKHSAFPLEDPHPGEPGYDPLYPLPCAKVMGAGHGRAKAFRPRSVVNISAMSYGSLSKAAIEALNRGAAIAGCLHNTGEGGVSPHHLHGGELIWQVGTGYFGCRTPEGQFDLDKLVATCARHPIRAIEIKLSQGAKPGRGGVLPAPKVTAEVSQIRGIPMGKDCISPSGHRAFHDVPSLIDFIERIAEATGLPVGIKSAVGQTDFFEQLADRMVAEGRGPDFITIDGGEGGTGAAPLVFADHVALPFLQAFPRVYRIFAERGLHEKVIFIGSGRLGLPESALLAFSLGCDMVNVAREAMLSIGCIQAQRCESGHCPTGVATQNKWLVGGLDPTLKSARFANYVCILRKELLWLVHACGVSHPAHIGDAHIELMDGLAGGRAPSAIFGYGPGFGHPSAEDLSTIDEIMAQGGRVNDERIPT
ncbi:MAG: FMN-binding glutamate synthase family protein [Myxococcales bacterium]|nr:FMN-binding glutamate synthase family protein [Myxococcales bacterium]